MQDILHWGVDLIVTIQSVHNPALDLFFNVITFLGGEDFYLVFLPVLYWCIDKTIAQRLAYLLLFSTYTNEVLKGIVRSPRPFEYDSRVLRLDKVSPVNLGYGFPSGHSQSAVSVWGYLAARIRRRWMWMLTGTLVVFIAFSRIYLGVHFPSDVLGGVFIGAIWLGLFLWLEPRLTPRLSQLPLGVQLGLAIAVPVVLLLLYSSRDAIVVMGTGMGLGVGIALERRFVRFSTGGSIVQRVMRLAIGAVVVVALREGLKLVFPGEGEALYIYFCVLRYSMVGVWVALGGPWLFLILRLATSAESSHGRPVTSHSNDTTKP